MSYFTTHAEYLERKQLYCYVSKDGEPAVRMLRTEAQELQLSLGDTAEWFTAVGGLPFNSDHHATFDFRSSGIYTYRTKATIKLDGKMVTPEPTGPHAALRAKYAKQVAEGTTGFYLWGVKHPGGDGFGKITEPYFHEEHEYRCTDISCHVSKEGEPAIRMLRTDAQELQAKLGDTAEWYLGVTNMSYWEELDFDSTSTYTYAIKQVSWSDMPAGVAVQEKISKEKHILLNADADGGAWIFSEKDKAPSYIATEELELASEQPWIAVQDSEDFHDTARKFLASGLSYTFHAKRYKITGIAKGYVLEGAV